MLDSVTIGVELIGFAAAFLTTIAFIPQVIQVWKSKSVEGLSLTTYIIFIIGVFLWFLYGLSIGSLIYDNCKFYNCSFSISNNILYN